MAHFPLKPEAPAKENPGLPSLALQALMNGLKRILSIACATSKCESWVRIAANDLGSTALLARRSFSLQQYDRRVVMTA